MAWDSELTTAFKDHDVDKIKALMKKCVDFNACREEDHRTPLSHMIEEGYDSSLITEIVNSDSFQFTEDTLVAIAEALVNAHSLLPILLEKQSKTSVSLDARLFSRRSLLRIAVERRSIYAVNQLMRHGSNPNLICKIDNHTPLSASTMLDGNNMMQAIIDSANFHFTNETSLAVLEALRTGAPELVPLLFKKPPTPDVCVDPFLYHGKSLSMIAFEKRYFDVVAILRNHGAASIPIIPKNALTKTKVLLGNGASGNVYAEQFNGKKVAVKYIDGKIHPPVDQMNEVQIMFLAKHPNIITLHGCVICPNGVEAVMEQMENGNFEEYLRNNPRKTEDDFKKVYTILFEIISAVIYLHSELIIHLDIKPGNILLGNSHSAKLCDFGLSIRIKSPRNYIELNRPSGSPATMAPEMFNKNSEGKLRITTASDVFSFGSTLAASATNDSHYSFDQFRDVNEINRFVAGGGQPTVPPSTATAITSLITWCCKTKPEERPTAIKIKEEMQTFLNSRSSQ